MQESDIIDLATFKKKWVPAKSQQLRNWREREKECLSRTRNCEIRQHSK